MTLPQSTVDRIRKEAEEKYPFAGTGPADEQWNGYNELTKFERDAFIAGATAEAEREEWISVKERLPEDYVTVLTWCPFIRDYLVQYHTPTYSQWSELEPATHWQPLPSPPVEKEGEKLKEGKE